MRSRLPKLKRPDKRTLGAFGLAVLSGFMVFACFPPLNAANLAYVGLVPFVWALRLMPEARWRLGYTAGLACWLPSLWFLTPVTVPGWFCLAAYCAVYWIPAGAVWGRFLLNWEPGKTWTALRMVVGGSAWWCVLEQLRGWLLTGFPWNHLGVSQWENYGLIQLASLGGVTLVSFVLMTMNLGLVMSLMGLVETLGRRLPRRAHPELYIPILLLAVSFTWGIREMRLQVVRPSRTIRMTVVQPMVGMYEKLDPALVRQNYRDLWRLSDWALDHTRPQLLLWPETALPEVYGSPQSVSMLDDLMSREVPILAGSLVTEEKASSGEEDTYLIWNASLLFLPETMGVADTYTKQHLVMFGEYIPFARQFPFLRKLSPFPDDVTPGKGSGVLELTDPSLRMGMLICFEDLMPALSRRRVVAGAEVLVNQTNDAWFDPYWGSVGHLSHAVFRSVEQRRPTVRATNSGVSAWVDTRGVVQQETRDPETGSFQTRGYSPFEVQVPENGQVTLYHRLPWAFPLLSAALSLLVLPVSDWGKGRFFHRRKARNDP